MKYKLVALDIDGTLLNSNHELVSENVNVIKKLVTHDVNFVLVTGRPDVMALEYANRLSIPPLILGYNGATMRNLETNEIFYAKYIDLEIVKEICFILGEVGAYYRLYCVNCVYSFNNWEFDEQYNIYAKFSRRLAETIGFEVLQSFSDLVEPVVKIVVFSEDETYLSNLKDRLKQYDVSIVFGSKNGLDINAHKVNKGQALVDYGEKIGIDKQQMIAIGDSENDLSMLKVVGMPITLENGSPLLKRYAKFITKSNDEAGVAYALKHMFASEFEETFRNIDILNCNVIFYGEERIASSLGTLVQGIAKYIYVGDDEFDIGINENTIVVVASFTQDMYVTKLEEKGLEYGTDFIMIDDFIKIIDQPLLHRINSNSNYYLIGGSESLRIASGRNFYLGSSNNVILENTSEIIKFLKNKKSNILGRLLIFIDIANRSELNVFLNSIGLSLGKNYMYYYNTESNQEQIQAILHTKAKYNLKCNYNSMTTDVTSSGDLVMCHSFIKFPIGNVMYDGFEEIFNSLNAKIINLSNANKSYFFCDSDCLYKMDNNNKITDTDPEYETIPLYSASKFRYGLAYDESCNLGCVTCRNSHIITPCNENVNEIHTNISENINSYDFVFVSYGEVFFSTYYQDLLNNYYSQNKILLQTNGQLLNENMLTNIVKKYEDIVVYISIDAASSGTYSKIRKSDFSKILSLLKRLKELKRLNKIKEVVISFVITSDNYYEIKDFVKLGLDNNVDMIVFAKFKNWRGLPLDEYIGMDVYNENNPFHLQFIELAQDTIFRDRRVFFQNLNNLIKKN